MGGTFDPIHLGHLSIAEAAMDQVELERVLFVPAGQPRLKQAKPVAPVTDRIEMVRLAIESNPKFHVCAIESHRPGPTYSVDTLEQLSAELGSRTDLFFILGMDVLGHLDQWKDPGRVLEICRLLVVSRPGEQDFDWPGFYRRVPEAKDKVQFVDAPLVDLSATEIRRLASAGEPLTGRVPDEVAEYIHNQGLYLKEREGRTTS